MSDRAMRNSINFYNYFIKTFNALLAFIQTYTRSISFVVICHKTIGILLQTHWTQTF